MTTLLSPRAVSGLAHVREVVGDAAEAQLWSLTDTQLAVEVAEALALL